jgi:hypothetical protein
VLESSPASLQLPFMLRIAREHACLCYIVCMTKLLERALEQVRRLPSETQDEIARAMLALAAAGSEPEEIDAAHLAAVLEGLAQAREGHLASDAEVETAFRRFDP